MAFDPLDNRSGHPSFVAENVSWLVS